ncbi:MAG: OmpA family protein [Myxococcota bacterium]|nr:OmpA family protein [Myxococcota bacterium]
MSHSRLRAFGISLCLSAGLASLPAFAETELVKPGQGMESRLFRTAVDTKGHFTVDGTQILPHNNISLSLMLDFGFNGWPSVEANKDVYDRTKIDSYIYSVLMFNWGLKDMVAFGLQIPIVVPSGTAYGVDVNGEPVTAAWSSKGGIGDIGIHAKLRWLRADRRPLGLGTVIMYQAPVGKASLAGEGYGGALAAKMIVDVEPRSWYKAALNVGVRLPLGFSEKNYLNKEFDKCPSTDNTCPSDVEHLLFKYGPQLTFGLGNSVSIWPGVMDLVVELYGNQLMNDWGASYLSTEANAGIKLYVQRSSYLMAGYAHGLPFSSAREHYGFQSMEHRMFIGFAFEPSIGDKDGDGIKDDLDKCPDDPEDHDLFEDFDGCPDPDNDRDGIKDSKDECPLVPEDKDGDKDEDGCPERGANDRDGDGLNDDVDKCPDDPEDLDQFEDENGCPDTDNDADSILDIHDACPNEPEDADSFEDLDGCPDPDNDKDRIPDVKDQCPNEPETYNGKDDADGCPDQGLVELTGTDIKILEKVYFKYDSAVIEERSFDLLEAVAATVVNNPQLDMIEIQGHADERGNDDYNLKLTADRAAAVMEFLTKKGVKAKKVRSVGYGEYCPIDSASNEAAWEKNRRVEFKVLSVDGAPTGVETSCAAAKKKGIGAK